MPEANDEQRATTLAGAFHGMRHLGLDVRQYFQYYGKDEEWHEALTFCVTGESEDDDVLIINFYKEQESSERFKMQFGYSPNGEWEFWQRESFKEVRELYGSVAFPIYVSALCLEIVWQIARDDQDNISEVHLQAMAKAISDLVIFLESAMMTRGMIPSVENSNVYGVVEAVLNKLSIEKSFDW